MSIELPKLIQAVQRAGSKGLSLGALARRWQLSSSEKAYLHQLARRLAEAGGLRMVRGGKVVWEHPSVVDGLVHVRSGGKGSLRHPDNPGEKLGVLGPRAMGAAIHGDYVLAHLRRRGPRWEARILQVLERRVAHLAGLLSADGRLIPQDPRYPDVRVENPDETRTYEGHLAAVSLETTYPFSGPLRGEVVEVFGPPDQQETEIRSLVFKYGLPHEFPPEVLQEADRLPGSIDPNDERQDLRHLPFVTIDGETAKDFDDAVCFLPRKSGGRLYVAIADVSHFVAPGSLLDQEARERGTSVYFPGYCIPMLPERLSNDLCSLRPEEDRAVLCAELLLDEDSRVTGSSVYPGVIRSRARLTYTEVAAFLKSTSAPEEEPLGQLRPLAELSRKMYALRLARGGLDFDLPEPEIILDLQGRPENLVTAKRTLAHRLIEECMLAANRAVAELLSSQGRAFLSRVHDPPPADKLQEFQQSIAYFNEGINLAHPDGLHGALADFLGHIKGKSTESGLHRLLLRSMAQAVYQPEANGHFGLALEQYCHFTSPIRRYPDLLVHRTLRAVMEGRAERSLCLEGEGQLASVRERRAMEAEREIVQLKKCQFMQEQVGEAFEGIIHHVASFGFFVELKGLPVEGLVPLVSLTDDFYSFDPEGHCFTGERRRRRFQLGDKVAIIVEGVDLNRREITFRIQDIESENSPVRTTGRRRSQRRRR